MLYSKLGSIRPGMICRIRRKYHAMSYYRVEIPDNALESLSSVF